MRDAVLRERTSLAAGQAEELVSACMVVLGVVRAQSQDSRFSVLDVTRGVQLLMQICGVSPRDAARLALASPDVLRVPADRLVRLMLLLRRLFPAAELSRVVEGLPAGALVDADLDALEHCALGVLAELRASLPEPLAQLLAQEEPQLFFGACSLLRLEELREAYDASGLAGLTDAQLRAEMATPRWPQWFQNVFVSSY